MIDIDNFLRQLNEEKDDAIQDNADYQQRLFEEYVLRKVDHLELRKDLYHRFKSGEEIMGERGLRKQLAAFDLSYFGRAYLPHYFVRKSPKFHEDLDAVWEKGVLKGLNPSSESKVIARLDGRRHGLAAPRGHAKSTNFTLIFCFII